MDKVCFVCKDCSSRHTVVGKKVPEKCNNCEGELVKEK